VDTDIANTQGFQHVSQLQQLRADSMADKPVHFFEVLFRTRASLASEVRDKAFAILGLSYNGSAFVAVPDYNQSVFDLCLEITMSAITHYRSLDVIAFLGNWGDHKTGSSSSWMPSWLVALPSSERPYKYLTGEMQFRKGKTRWRHYEICPVQLRSKWQASLDSKPIFNYDSGCLTVKGRIFDILKGLSSTYGGLAGSTSATDTIEVQNSYKADPFALSGYLSGISEPDAAVLNALYYLLSYLANSEDVGSTSSKSALVEYLQFTNCLPPQSYVCRDDEEPPDTRVMAWFHQNQNFNILGKTLNEWKRLATRHTSPVPLSYKARPVEAEAILQTILQWGMRLSVSKRGYLGWAVERARAGDSIAILLGCTVPVVLRPYAEGGWYVVGDAIIYGIMEGEAFADLPPIEEWGFLTLH
jgi:hypothetical protein